jgi:hypothetical protein
VYVTKAQRLAAQAMLQRDAARGRKTPSSVRKIAAARPACADDEPAGRTSA